MTAGHGHETAECGVMRLIFSRKFKLQNKSNPVEADPLGVGIAGGLVELSHSVGADL